MINKKVIIDFGSPKVRKNAIIIGTAIIIVIAALLYFGFTEHNTGYSKENKDSEDRISTSEAGIEKKEEAKVTIYVDVSGAVKEPSVIMIAEGSRVFEAIEAAGGVTKDANISQINRAEILEDGTFLYIPTDSEVKDGTAAAASSGSYNGDTTGSSSGSGQGKININTADSTALQELNGVGPATAEKIIDYRTNIGKFNKIEDIKNVSGIGDKTFEKLSPHIKV